MDTDLSGGQSELALALALDSIQQAQASMETNQKEYTLETSYAEAPDPFDFVGMLPPKTLPKAASEKDLAQVSKTHSNAALEMALSSINATQASASKLPASRPTSRPSSQKGSQINLAKAVSQTLLPSTSQIRLDPKTAMSRSASQNSMKKVGRSQENMAKATSKKSLRWQDEAAATDAQQGSLHSLIQESHRAQSLIALEHQSDSSVPKASSHKSILKSDSRPQSAHDVQAPQDYDTPNQIALPASRDLPRSIETMSDEGGDGKTFDRLSQVQLFLDKNSSVQSLPKEISAILPGTDNDAQIEENSRLEPHSSIKNASPEPEPSHPAIRSQSSDHKMSSHDLKDALQRSTVEIENQDIKASIKSLKEEKLPERLSHHSVTKMNADSSLNYGQTNSDNETENFSLAEQAPVISPGTADEAEIVAYEPSVMDSQYQNNHQEPAAEYRAPDCSKEVAETELVTKSQSNASLNVNSNMALGFAMKAIQSAKNSMDALATKTFRRNSQSSTGSRKKFNGERNQPTSVTKATKKYDPFADPDAHSVEEVAVESANISHSPVTYSTDEAVMKEVSEAALVEDLISADATIKSASALDANNAHSHHSLSFSPSAIEGNQDSSHLTKDTSASSIHSYKIDAPPLSLSTQSIPRANSDAKVGDSRQSLVKSQKISKSQSDMAKSSHSIAKAASKPTDLDGVTGVVQSERKLASSQPIAQSSQHGASEELNSEKNLKAQPSIHDLETKGSSAKDAQSQHSLSLSPPAIEGNQDSSHATKVASASSIHSNKIDAPPLSLSTQSIPRANSDDKVGDSRQSLVKSQKISKSQSDMAKSSHSIAKAASKPTDLDGVTRVVQSERKLASSQPIAQISQHDVSTAPNSEANLEAEPSIHDLEARKSSQKLNTASTYAMDIAMKSIQSAKNSFEALVGKISRKGSIAAESCAKNEVDEATANVQETAPTTYDEDFEATLAPTVDNFPASEPSYEQDKFEPLAEVVVEAPVQLPSGRPKVAVGGRGDGRSAAEKYKAPSPKTSRPESAFGKVPEILASYEMESRPLTAVSSRPKTTSSIKSNKSKTPGPRLTKAVEARIKATNTTGSTSSVSSRPHTAIGVRSRSAPSSSVKKEAVPSSPKRQIKSASPSIRPIESGTDYAKLVTSLRHDVVKLKLNVHDREAMIEGLKMKDKSWKESYDKLKQAQSEMILKNTRILLDRQKKAFQIEMGKVKRQVKILKYQRTPVVNPLIEAEFFPYLTRTGYEKPEGILAHLPQRATDYFAFNPPPDKINDGMDSWWWGQKTASKGAAKGSKKIERPASPAKTTTLPAATANASQPSESIQDASLTVGDRICVMINEERCMGNLCYLGPLEFHPETELFCGIQLDRPLGNHGGVIRGRKYFECPETHGIFVKADKAIPIRGTLTRTMSKRGSAAIQRESSLKATA